MRLEESMRIAAEALEHAEWCDDIGIFERAIQLLNTGADALEAYGKAASFIQVDQTTAIRKSLINQISLEEKRGDTFHDPKSWHVRLVGSDGSEGGVICDTFDDAKELFDRLVREL